MLHAVFSFVEDIVEKHDLVLSNGLREHRFLLAYFSTPTCNVCKVLRPKVEQLAARLEEVGFVYIDSSEHPEIAGQHTVFAVPTIILFHEGRELRRFSRNVSVYDIEQALERYLGM